MLRFEPGWTPIVLPKCQWASSWSCKLDSAARSTVARSTVMFQGTGMAMALTGYGTSPMAVTLTGPSGTEDEMGLNAGHAPGSRTCGRPWVLPPDGLVIQSGGPLAATGVVADRHQMVAGPEAGLAAMQRALDRVRFFGLAPPASG